MSEHEDENESIDEFADLSRSAFEEKQKKSKEEKHAEKERILQEKQQKKQQREMLKQAAAEERIAKKMAKQDKKQQPVEQFEQDLGEFEIEPADREPEQDGEIMGRDKRVLIAKIQQFKELFDDNAKVRKFKIKKNASVEELENIIAELNVIVDIDACGGFMMDSILQCIKLIEGVSANSKNFNVQGLSDILKSNKEFHRLTKMLFIKYNCFSQVPPELQLVLLVAVSAHICRTKNQNKENINHFLNQPV